MRKILFTTFGAMANRGCAEILEGTLIAMGPAVSRFEYGVTTPHPAADQVRLTTLGRRYGITIRAFEHAVASRKKLEVAVRVRARGPVRGRIAEDLLPYEWADIVVALGGDTLTAEYGQASLTSILWQLWLATLAGRPLVLLGQSIGPFQSNGDETRVRRSLQRARLITLREQLSYQLVKGWHLPGVRVEPCADPAYLVEPAPEARVAEIFDEEGMDLDSGRLLVGISTSEGIARYAALNQDDYAAEVADAIDELIASRHVEVLLIPHVFDSPHIYDDRFAAVRIYQRVKQKRQCHLILGSYTACEMKGLVGRCDAFVGARMHPVIEALSLAVPAIAVAYSQKTYGVFEQVFNSTDGVLHVKGLKGEQLAGRVSELIDHREKMAEHIRKRLPAVRALAQRNGSLLIEVLEENRLLE